MPRRVFLSYPCNFPRHPAVESICDFLQQRSVTILIPPEFGWTYYSAMELAIEACDTFVAVLDPISDGSTQLLMHLGYAATLHDARHHSRPRIFGVWLEQTRARVIPAIQAYGLETLTTDSYQSLLEDLPRRTY